IDQAVDRGGAIATLAAHDERRLAGEGRELHLTVDVPGNMARKRGLARAGEAEQAEDLRRPARAWRVLEPSRDGLEGRVLMRREFGHRIRKNTKKALVATPRVLKQASTQQRQIWVDAQ